MAHGGQLFSKFLCPSISTCLLGIDWIPGMDSKNNFLSPHVQAQAWPLGTPRTKPSSVWIMQAKQGEGYRATRLSWFLTCFDPKGRAMAGPYWDERWCLLYPVGSSRQRKFTRKGQPRDQMGGVGKGGRNKVLVSPFVHSRSSSKELATPLSTRPVSCFPRAPSGRDTM